jgi:galactose-1-phosphate uridylyltransferase
LVGFRIASTTSSLPIATDFPATCPTAKPTPKSVVEEDGLSVGSAPERRITDLDALVEGLPTEEREIANRLFDVRATTGRLEVPEEMQGWVEKNFGSIDAVREQRIVRVTNRMTLDGTLFNELRASRPFDAAADNGPEVARREIEETHGDPFCAPEKGTPADVFGRVRGAHSTTASNVAKYDGFHGLVVFDDHDPLAFTHEKVDDYVSVALEWIERALAADPEAKYPFLMWNCLWRAGSSVIHGHAQVTATSGAHYPKVERLRRAALQYESAYGSDYFWDLYQVHEALGLGITPPPGSAPKVRGFASLTPVKEKEVVLLGPDLGEHLRHLLASVVMRYTRDLGVSSFNVAFYLRPSAPTEEDWSSFPVVIHVVDRGDVANRTSDIGAMELYAAPVVSSDPFQVAHLLKE